MKSNMIGIVSTMKGPLEKFNIETALDKTEPVLIVGSGSSTMPMK